MKKDSPNKFLGGIAAVAARGLSTSANAGGNFDRAKYERLAQAGGVFGRLGQQVLDQNPVAPTAPTVDMSGDPSLAAAGITGDGDMDQANPFEGKTFQITPTTPANMKGNAKPVFNENTSNTAAMMYGTLEQRQMSMGQQAPVFMKDQTGDGKITQADVIKARIEGYKE